MEEFLKLFDVKDILLHVLNTVILFVAIRFLVYKPVRRYLNARTERVGAALDEAAGKQAQAQQAVEEAQATRKAAEAEAIRVQTDGAARAQSIGEELVAAAKQQAGEILEKARQEAEHIKSAAQEEVQTEALTMAVDIAERMIGRELATKDNETLAREFLTKVG